MAITPPASSQLSSGPTARRRSRGLGLWPLILLLAALALCLIAVWIIRLPKANRNTLAIRELAQSQALDIAIQPPVELDFMSKAEVLKLRTEAVYRHPDLIVGDYTPSDAAFREIEDHLPWWGLTGHFYYGRGERSIEGSAEETRFLLNPYLLVAVEFDGLSYKLDPARVKEADLRRPDFPLYCEASHLRWLPPDGYAEVTYEISQCIARMVPWASQQITLADAYFSLIAYNARDMNLNYLYVSYPDSPNIVKPDAPTAAYAIPHYLHRGHSCGYPGGCNNMSPDTPEISWLDLNGLPAKALVRLWTHKPRSVEQWPDLVFVIHFK